MVFPEGKVRFETLSQMPSRKVGHSLATSSALESREPNTRPTIKATKDSRRLDNASAGGFNFASRTRTTLDNVASNVNLWGASKLSQPKDLETERGGSAGLDVVVGENAAQSKRLHGSQMQAIEGSAVNRATKGIELANSDRIDARRCGNNIEWGRREGLVENAR